MATTAIDPATAATAWTKKYTDDRQALITTQTTAAANTATGLKTLSSAITAYQDSLTALSTKKTMLEQSATFSNSAIATATASSTATPGTYSFFVESVASANQVSLSGIGGNPTPATGMGNMNIALADGSNFTVDLSKADSDGVGGLSVKEIAAAINAEPHNNSMVTASIITIGNVEQLVLTSGKTGTAGAIKVTTPDMTDPSDSALAAALSATPKTLVAAQDAVVWLGEKSADTSNRITQSSNTFSAISGVSFTVTKAQTSGDTPVTLTVATDDKATTANVQSFVDSYNKLKTALDTLTDPGDPASGLAAGIFSSDSGVRVLRDQISRTLSETSVGALATFGITTQYNGVGAAGNGTLAINSTRLAAALKSNPNGLDLAIGTSAAGKSSGIAGKLDSLLDKWSNSAGGQLATRTTTVTDLQDKLTKSQTKFEADYVSLYNRYKAQFTTLQDVTARMKQNTDLFDALWGSTSSDS